MTAQMRNFLDQTGSLWMSGSLVGKVGSVFTSTGTSGGNESTILTFIPTLLHHGMIYVGLPYSCPELTDISELKGGSPYGAGTIAGADGSRTPSAKELAMARFPGQTRRRDHAAPREITEIREARLTRGSPSLSANLRALTARGRRSSSADLPDNGRRWEARWNKRYACSPPSPGSPRARDFAREQPRNAPARARPPVPAAPTGTQTRAVARTRHRRGIRPGGKQENGFHAAKRRAGGDASQRGFRISSPPDAES